MKKLDKDIIRGPVILEREELELVYYFIANQFVHYEQYALTRLVRAMRDHIDEKNDQ